MNRLTQRLDSIKKNGKKALASYFVYGDPNPDWSLETLHTLASSGADIIELGVPFSDPMADGPVIQKGHERALEHKVSLRDCLHTLSEFRKTNTSTPVILMGYANPIERMGYKNFAQAAADAGLDGLLTVDLPPEEAPELQKCLDEHGIHSIFLLAPTSSTERIARVAARAAGFIYYVSLKGVTGAGKLDVADVNEKLGAIREASELPILVGFGIKDGASAKAVAQLADGVVVGSALVDILGHAQESSQAQQALAECVGSIRHALDSLA